MKYGLSIVFGENENESNRIFLGDFTTFSETKEKFKKNSNLIKTISAYCDGEIVISEGEVIEQRIIFIDPNGINHNKEYENLQKGTWVSVAV